MTLNCEAVVSSKMCGGLRYTWFRLSTSNTGAVTGKVVKDIFYVKRNEPGKGHRVWDEPDHETGAEDWETWSFDTMCAPTGIVHCPGRCPCGGALAAVPLRG